MHLGEVMILEVVVERLEELIEGDHDLVGQLGEGERIRFVVSCQRAAAARRGVWVSGGAKTCR